MPMPEYRRFICYFYEYTDGRKQRNAGFAKVELRDGVWRILLKINAGSCPESPIWVYGFVRETNRLRGVLLGEIRPVQQIAEEWAFRADAPIGEGSYVLGDLAGIWIESSDGRRFVTAWDDGEIDTESFVKEASLKEKEASAKAELTEKAEETENRSEAEAESEPEAGSEAVSGIEAGSEAAAEPEAGLESASEASPEPGNGMETEFASEPEPEIGGEPGSLGEPPIVAEEAETEPGATAAEFRETPENVCAESDYSGEEQTGAIDSDCGAADVPERARAVLEELFRKRAAFQPFADAEIENCVMILPCDIVRLQQENWNVGRSSFLQHGFYQYRHLLLGMAGDGTYILGVPGICNPQETYMARMFGYDRFRESARRSGGRNFGYWCRGLRQV